jgi:hypothetical protein
MREMGTTAPTTGDQHRASTQRKKIEAETDGIISMHGFLEGENKNRETGEIHGDVITIF